MAAIVTDRLKLQLIDQLVTILQDNSKPTYVGFGRSEAWNDSDTAPIPSNIQMMKENLKMDYNL